MAWYMVQIAYTPEAWAAQIKNPGDRVAAINSMIEPAGLRIEYAWYSFGEYDLVLIAQGPNNADIAGGIIAAAAGGSLKATKTTPLLTKDEMTDALKTAGSISYRPPEG